MRSPSWRRSKKILALCAAAGAFLLPAAVFTPGAGAAEIREIKVTAATSANFRKDPQWKRLIYDRVVFANKIFQPQFQVRFKVEEYTSWEPKDETQNMKEQLKDLETFVPTSAHDLVIGFHKMSKPFLREKVEDIEALGMARFFHGYVAVRDPFLYMDEEHQSIVLTHELGHVFGAVHIPQPQAIMCPVVLPGKHTLTFDSNSVLILGITRGVDLSAGAGSLGAGNLQKLISHYEGLIKANSFHAPLIEEVAELRQVQAKEFKGPPQQPQQPVSVKDVLKNFPNMPQLEKFLGLAEAANGKTQPAPEKSEIIAARTQALEKDPENPHAQADLAAAYFEAGAMDRAIALLEKLKAKSPTDPAVLGHLAEAHLKKEEFQKAAQFFYYALDQKRKKVASPLAGTALKEIPQSELLKGFGRAYLKLKEPTRAITQLEAAKKLAPQDKEVYRDLAQAYLQSHAYPNALREIEAGLKFNGADPELYLLRFDVLLEQGKKEEAFAAARNGIKVAGEGLQAVFHKKMAANLLKQGKAIPAFEELRNSVELNPMDPETHVMIASIYNQYHYPDDARRFYQYALKIDPRNEAAQKGLRSIKR